MVSLSKNPRSVTTPMHSWVNRHLPIPVPPNLPTIFKYPTQILNLFNRLHNSTCHSCGTSTTTHSTCHCKARPSPTTFSCLLSKTYHFSTPTLRIEMNLMSGCAFYSSALILFCVLSGFLPGSLLGFSIRDLTVLLASSFLFIVRFGIGSHSPTHLGALRRFIVEQGCLWYLFSRTHAIFKSCLHPYQIGYRESYWDFLIQSCAPTSLPSHPVSAFSYNIPSTGNEKPTSNVVTWRVCVCVCVCTVLPCTCHVSLSLSISGDLFPKSTHFPHQLASRTFLLLHFPFPLLYKPPSFLPLSPYSYKTPLMRNPVCLLLTPYSLLLIFVAQVTTIVIIDC